MSDYSINTSGEYFDTIPTGDAQACQEEEVKTLAVEEKVYGVNKPKRHTIRAKITYDKNK